MTTLDDGTYTAVVDRFEDDLAVLLIEDDGSVGGEVVLETASLPAGSQHVDAVLRVDICDGAVSGIRDDPAATRDRKETTQSRFDRLSERPPSGDDEQ